MRVVLDSNILARAASGPPGLAAELLLHCLKPPIELCLCPFQITELSRVLRYDRVRRLHGMDDATIDAFLHDLQLASIVVAPVPPVPSITSDPDDDEIIAAAILASARYLCTLDRHLLKPHVFEYCEKYGVELISDKDLLERLRKSED